MFVVTAVFKTLLLQLQQTLKRTRYGPRYWL